MKKAILAAGIVLAASLALTGCAGAPRQIKSTEPAKNTIEVVEAATACTQTLTTAKTTEKPAPKGTTPAVNAAKPVTTTAATTAAKPVTTTAATTAAKPAATTTATTAADANSAVDEVMKQLISDQNAAEQKALSSAGAGSVIVSTEYLPGKETSFKIGVLPNGGSQVIYYYVGKDYCMVEGADLAPAPVSTTAAAQPSQNPIMNFIGNYGNGRATMYVSEVGKDSASIRVSWSGSAADSSTWTMSGTVTTLGDRVIVDYCDCVKETVSYDADGNMLVDVIEYANGSGSLTFEGSRVIWADYEENIADGSVFEYYR